MERLHGSVTLRPTRIGFLVRPSQTSLSTIRQIFRLNACLWGGTYNPIIPVCSSLPFAWRSEHFREISGRGLADAYIRFFEPDVFVEAERGLAKEVGIAEARFHSRVVTLKHLVENSKSRAADFAFGLNVFDVYRELYKTTFQFASRKKRLVATFDGDESASSYFEAVFGAFPNSSGLNYIRKGYDDAFEPEFLPSTAASFLKLAKKDYQTPFACTMHGLETERANRDDPTIFIFDPNKVVDLIDFWNLEQFKSDVVPINVHWLKDCETLIHQSIKKNYRPLPNNKNGVMIRTTVEYGRSISKLTVESLTKENFRNLPEGSWSLKHWYDPIWRSDWRQGIQPRRVKLSAESEDFDESIEAGNKYLTIKAVSPKFARRYNFVDNNARWVNVVRLSDAFSSESKFALTFPSNTKNNEFPRLHGVNGSIISREGIVLLQRYKSSKATLSLISQQEAIVQWLAPHGVKATPSSSGRNAEQVLLAVGGASRCGVFADEATVRLLDKMAKTIQREEDGTTAQYPDRTATISEWKQVVGRRSNSLFNQTTIASFTDSNIIKIGISLNCPHCTKSNWFSIADTGYRNVCERCLKEFEFPQAGGQLGEGIWRYRVMGPFSVPNYADGAYATALTLRLFKDTLSHDRAPTTFSTGMNVEIEKTKFELDFFGWYTEDKKYWIDPSPVVVFGETKSFGSEVFQEKDINRLKLMAEKFPGSFVVFAAMKKELSKEEIVRIRKFAEWGRILQPNGEPRALAIVLTGVELFANWKVSDAWKDHGGRHTDAVKHPSVHIDDLWTFAELTQDLYLGLPAIWKWRHSRRRKKPAPSQA